MTLHYNFRKGMPILIITKDGKKIKDIYLETKSKYLICKNKSYDFEKIRSLTIWRENEK